MDALQPKYNYIVFSFLKYFHKNENLYSLALIETWNIRKYRLNWKFISKFVPVPVSYSECKGGWELKTKQKREEKKPRKFASSQYNLFLRRYYLIFFKCVQVFR